MVALDLQPVEPCLEGKGSGEEREQEYVDERIDLEGRPNLCH